MSGLRGFGSLLGMKGPALAALPLTHTSSSVIREITGCQSWTTDLQEHLLQTHTLLHGETEAWRSCLSFVLML